MATQIFFIFIQIWGKLANLTNIFHRGWNQTSWGFDGKSVPRKLMKVCDFFFSLVVDCRNCARTCGPLFWKLTRWQLKYFSFFIPTWRRLSNLTNIFFKWVETTNQLKAGSSWKTSPNLKRKIYVNQTFILGFKMLIFRGVGEIVERDFSEVVFVGR